MELNILQNKFKNSYETKSIITNIYRTQAYDLIMSGYYCIGFIDFILKDKSLLDYTNVFFPIDYEKNESTKKWKNYILLFMVSIENLKNLKYHSY